MAVDPKRTNKITLAEYRQLVETETVSELKSILKGYGVSLQKGDTFKVGDIFLKSMSSALLDDQDEWNSVYWGFDTTVSRGELRLDGEIADAVFCRSGKLFPSNEEKVSGKENLGGLQLYMRAMKDLKLSPEQVQFNLNLSSRKESIARLESLSEKTLRVIGEFTAYSKKFNSKKEENWGSQANHWQAVKLLFFELVEEEGVPA